MFVPVNRRRSWGAMGFGNYVVFGLFAAYLHIVGGKFWELYHAHCLPGTPLAHCVQPLVPAGTPLQLWLFASTSGVQQPGAALFEAAQAGHGVAALLLGPEAVVSGEEVQHNVTLPFRQLGTRRNGTLYAHAYFFVGAASWSDGSEQSLVAYHVVPITRFLPARTRTAKRLVGSARVQPDGNVAALPQDDGNADADACEAEGVGAGNGTCVVAAAAADQSTAAQAAALHGKLVTHMRPHLKLRAGHPVAPVKRCARLASRRRRLAHSADFRRAARLTRASCPRSWCMCRLRKAARTRRASGRFCCQTSS